MLVLSIVTFIFFFSKIYGNSSSVRMIATTTSPMVTAIPNYSFPTSTNIAQTTFTSAAMRDTSTAANTQTTSERIIINATSSQLPVISFHQPKFCSIPSWNPAGSIIADDTVLGADSYDFFIDRNNTIYVTAYDLDQILIFNNGVLTTSLVSASLIQPRSLFVMPNTNIYVMCDIYPNYIYQLILVPGTNQGIPIDPPTTCRSVFMDIYYNMYCSSMASDQILKYSTNNNINIATSVAGDTISGTAANRLFLPNGIFVDTNLNLYVADSGNDRIQFFYPGQINGRTLIGSGAVNNFTLSYPTGITLDGNGYLFIADSNNGRIIMSGNLGTICVIGCSHGSSLWFPRFIHFDSHGNIYVNELGTARIQKFTLTTALCEFEQAANSSIGNKNSTTTTTTTTDKAILTTTMKDVPFQSTLNEGTTSTRLPLTFINGITSTRQLNASLWSSMPRSTSTVGDTTTSSIDSILTSTNSASTQATKISTAQNNFSITHAPATSTMMDIATSATTNDKVDFHQSSTSFTELSTQEMNYITTQDGLSSMTDIASTMEPVTSVLLLSFVPKNCINSYQIGPFCNISSFPCDSLNPCQNMGTCINNASLSLGYVCVCQAGFNGTNCQFDIQPCKSTTCWNNGTCSISSENKFSCSCIYGWEGSHCEKKVDYCRNITCFNNGVCRSLYLGYQCECLFGSYSGSYCEHTDESVVIKQYISKSFASVAIVVISSVVIFIIALDVMKYIFRIDVARHQRNRIRRKRALKNRKPAVPMQPRVAVRFIYVNKLPVIQEAV